jgi:predicted nucleic acid-binding protein
VQHAVGLQQKCVRRLGCICEHRNGLIGGHDLFIGAHARVLGLTLVTNNTRAFKRVPDWKLENWA